MRKLKKRDSAPTHIAHVAVTPHASAGDGSDSGIAEDEIDPNGDAESRRILEAARVIADGVRRAAEPISRRSAASVHVEQDAKGTRVVAGGPGAPMAAQFENEGSRHPVYPRGPREKWHWGEQPYRPFLESGAEEAADAAAEAFAAYCDDLADELGSDH